MLPILIKFGPITIYSYGVFLFLALFAGLYWWWKIGRDEHWEENKLFDIYFFSLFSFFVSGRVAYVITHPELHSLLSSMALLTHPGLVSIVGIVSSVIVVYLMSRKEGWEVWKVMDVWVVVVATISVIASVGAMLNGSNPGIISSYGYIHPGDTVTRLPVDIWTFGWSLITFGIVSRVRKNFRFYTWYKGDLSVARDGLSSLVALLLLGLYLGVYGVVTEGVRLVKILPLYSLMGVMLSFVAIGMIYWRSGKHKQKSKGGHV